MEITKKTNGDTITLIVKGRLDTLTSPQLQDEVNKIGEAVKHLVLDFKDVEYVSSAGLRVILLAHKIMSTRGDSVVTNCSKEVIELFEMTGFLDILKIEH